MTIRHRIYDLLEPTEGDDLWGRRVDIFLMMLILLNVIAVILSTVEGIHTAQFPGRSWSSIGSRWWFFRSSTGFASGAR